MVLDCRLSCYVLSSCTITKTLTWWFVCLWLMIARFRPIPADSCQCAYLNYLSQRGRYFSYFSLKFFPSLPCLGSPSSVSKLFLSFLVFFSYPPFDLSQACLCYKACSGHMKPELLEGGGSQTLLHYVCVCVQYVLVHPHACVRFFLCNFIQTVLEEVLRLFNLVKLSITSKSLASKPL